MNDESRPQSLSKVEAAGRLKVSLRTLHRLLEAGELEGVRDGPKGGLRPTRASVERRLEQLAASTSVPHVEAELVAAESPASAPDMNGDATAMGSRVEPAPATEVSNAPRPRRGRRLVRGTGRIGGRLLRRGRRAVMRAIGQVAKRPARAARCVIAAALIVGLIALGATRELPGAAAARGDVTLLVITSPRDDGKARHRTRLRCRVTGAESVKVYVRRGLRARCTPVRDGRETR